MKFTARASVLKGMVSVLSSITDNVKLHCEEEGMRIVAVDPAHIAMVVLNIAKADLEGYTGDDSEYGLDLSKLNSILKLAGDEDDCNMELSDRITVRVGNITRRMAALDTGSMTDPKVPDIQMDVSVPMKAADLQYIMRTVSDIGDTVTLSVSDKVFKVVSEDDVQSSEFEWTPDGISEGSAQSTFPKDYVLSAVKAIPGRWDVVIGLTSDYPCKIGFGADTGGWFLIAPRVEAE